MSNFDMIFFVGSSRRPTQMSDATMEKISDILFMLPYIMVAAIILFGMAHDGR